MEFTKATWDAVFTEEICDVIYLHGAMLFSIVGSTVDHINCGRPLLSLRGKKILTKVNASTAQIVVSGLIGGAIAYGFAMLIYAPTSPLRAAFAGLLVVPVIHEGRIASAFRAQNPFHRHTSKKKGVKK